jgi:hypothetical protein
VMVFFNKIILVLHEGQIPPSSHLKLCFP